jgi:hypothetical protein
VIRLHNDDVGPKRVPVGNGIIAALAENSAGKGVYV